MYNTTSVYQVTTTTSEPDKLSCTDFPALNWTSLIFGLITLICLIFSIIWFIKMYIYSRSKENESDAKTKGLRPIPFRNVIATLFAVFGSFLTNASMNATLILCMLSKGDILVIASVFQAAAWLITALLILITFIHRLYIMFKGTIFELNKKTFCGLIGSVICMVACGCIAITLFIVQGVEYAFALGFITLILYICCILAMLAMFVCSLFKVKYTYIYNI